MKNVNKLLVGNKCDMAKKVSCLMRSRKYS